MSRNIIEQDNKMSLNEKKTGDEESLTSMNRNNKEEGKSDDEEYVDLGSIDALAELVDFSDVDSEEEEEIEMKQELLVAYLDDAKVVEENDLTPNVRKQYTSANVSFVYWLFDHGCEELFVPDIWSELMVLKKRAGVEFVKSAIREWLTARSKCPIKLEEMEYDKFFSYICSIKRDDNTYFSFSCYESKKTALTYFYTSFGLVQSEIFRTRLKKAFSSLRKAIKKDDEKVGKKQKSGKDCMTFLAYHFTCHNLVQSGTPEDIFTLCFLTLQWNLISRTESTEMISINNLRWEDDHLKVFFPRHKSDQAGLTSRDPRHIYANPYDPVVCPIQALSSYLICYPGILSSQSGKLFPGKLQKKRFGKNLIANLKKHYHEYQAMGASPEDLGTHSVRKGAATYCCTGVHPGPPIVSVCLRAGWTLGRVKERYLKYESGGDQLVGRCLTGINPQSPEFSTSPIYLHSLDDAQKEVLNQLKQHCFPLANRQIFSHTATMLLASFIYHEPWLKGLAQGNSLFLNNPFFSFSHLFPNRKDHVIHTCPWEPHTQERPVYTGIPLHCSILNKLMEVYQMQKELPEKIKMYLKNELDTRQLGGDGLAGIKNEIKQNFENIESRIGKALDEFKVRGNSDNDEEDAAWSISVMDADGNPAPARVSQAPTKLKEYGVWAHYWGGKIRKVPKGYTLPKSSPLLNMWLSWHLPDVSKKVQ